MGMGVFRGGGKGKMGEGHLWGLVGVGHVPESPVRHRGAAVPLERVEHPAPHPAVLRVARQLMEHENRTLATESSKARASTTRVCSRADAT